MSDSPAPASGLRPAAASRAGAPPRSWRGPWRERLDRLVGWARLVLWWERAWPALWLPLLVLFLFLTLSWLGLWLDLAPLSRQIGVALFGLAALASLWPLLRLRWPARVAALGRLDRDSGLKHGPARTIEDGLALGENDAGSRALWDLHRHRAHAAVAALRLSTPRPGMARRDRFAVRAAALVALVGERLRRRSGVRNPAPERLRLAPRRAGGAVASRRRLDRSAALHPHPAADDRSRRRPAAPARPGEVDRRDPRRRQGRGRDRARARARGPARRRRTSGRICASSASRSTGDADLSVRTGLASGVRLAVEAIPDKPPEIAFAGPPEVNVRGTFNLTYRAKDDYGIASVEGLVEKGEGFIGRRALVPAPRMALTLPPDAQGEADTKATVDLTQHPWAGAPGEADPRRQGRGRAGGTQRAGRFHAAAAALHEAARPRARRAAAHARARSRRPPARPGGARRAPHRAGALHAAMGRVHGPARRPPSACARQRATPTSSRSPNGSGRWRSRSRTATSRTPSASCAPPRSGCARRSSAAPPTRRSSA